MTGFTMPRAGWKVTLDGRDITAGIDPQNLSVSIGEKRGGEADQLDIVIQDREGKVAIPPAGRTLRISMGWLQGGDLPIGLIDKGSFKVDEARFSGPPDILTIRARSADFTDAFRVRRSRSFVGKTVGEVIRAIAGDNGLKASVDSGLSGKTIPALGHGAKSDAALLAALGRRFDAAATVKAGTLIFAPIGKGKTASGKALPTETITRQQTVSIDYARVERDAYDGTEAVWHDKATGTHKTVQAGHKGTGKAKRIRKVHHSEADAKQAAEAEATRADRRKAEATLTLAYGRPDITPERPIALAGFKPEIDARKWVVAEATHRMDGQGGLMTDLKLEALS